MTIPLTGAAGLFTRVGHLGGILNRINTDRGDISTGIPAKIVTLEADYPSSNNPQLLDGINTALAGWQSNSDGFLSQLATIAANTIIKMADDDVKLTSLDITTALGILIAQMKTAVASVNDPAVSVTVTPAGANSGDAVVLATVKGKDGKNLDYVFAENLDVLCTADSQVSASLGREPLSIKGDNAQTNELNFDWPKGSGAFLSLNAVPAGDDASTATNHLTNGDFETFTVANTPDTWPILVGSAGTTIFKSSGGNAYNGSAALQYTGNGAELTSIAQPFNDVAGTTAKLKPQTVYSFNCWVKVSSVPGAGVLEISLVDGSNVTINDDAATANSATKSLPAATTSYVAFNGTFRTPSILPSAVKLRIRLSTALTNTVSVFVDHVTFVAMTQMYSGGPFVSAHSGNAKLILNDAYTIAVANDYSGAFQKLFERLFSMRTLGLQLPSTAGGTISDSLVT